MSGLTREQAIRLAESRWWESSDVTDESIVRFQLFEERLCMDFAEFQLALERVLGRPVFTHELGLNVDGIKREYLGAADPPTFEEIVNLIPEEKRIIVALDDEESA
jgi:hypothetical protein